MKKGRGKSERREVEGGEEGLVVRVDSRLCHVLIGEERRKCRVRGVLFRDEDAFTKPVAVGDRVRVQRQKSPPDIVVEVLPRRSRLSRPSYGRRREQVIAANLDRAILVQSVAAPALNLRLLDRMLVSPERGEFGAVIVLNKVDLLDDRSLLAPVRELYAKLGYDVLETSTITGEGIEALRTLLHEGISVFAGMSGVGKSALLTAVQPDLALTSRAVSDLTGKGKHTTTHVALLELEGGGWVVDTPGVREFGVAGLEAWEVGACFREFREFLGACRFRTCTHTHEGSCAVKQAVEDGAIHELRYDSYLRIVESLDQPY
ncbi:MAG: ribosome small subunit-dependent GTPase A [Planctomycetota bacterium]